MFTHNDCVHWLSHKLSVGSRPFLLFSWYAGRGLQGWSGAHFRGPSLMFTHHDCVHWLSHKLSVGSRPCLLFSWYAGRGLQRWGGAHFSRPSLQGDEACKCCRAGNRRQRGHHATGGCRESVAVCVCVERVGERKGANAAVLVIVEGEGITPQVSHCAVHG